MVVLTGAKGLLGSHVSWELDQAKIKHYDIDITDYHLHNYSEVERLFKERKVTRIIHCAAVSRLPEVKRNPRLAFDCNVKATFNLLDVSARNKIEQFIYVSSSSIYGDFNNEVITETHGLKPKEIYGATKASSDLLVQAYGSSYGLPYTIIRTSSIYGMGDRDRLIPNLIKRALNDAPMEIEGTGELKRAFTHAEDIAQAIVLAINNKEALNQIFHIAGDKEYSILEIAQIIQKELPESTIEFKEGRKIDLDRGKLDISKAEKVLGWKPKQNIEESIKEIIYANKVS